MSRARPAADVLGLAHVVADLPSDVTYPGDPGVPAVIKRRERQPCLIVDPATKDDLWIPQVALLGWLTITRDATCGIQQHRAEIGAVKDSSARMLALAGDEARGTWQQLEILMRHWRASPSIEVSGDARPRLGTDTGTAVCHIAVRLFGARGGSAAAN